MSTATVARNRRSSRSAKGKHSVGPAPASAKSAPARKPLPDYMARILARQPVPMSEEATRALWEDERGDR